MRRIFHTKNRVIFHHTRKNCVISHERVLECLYWQQLKRNQVGKGFIRAIVLFETCLPTLLAARSLTLFKIFHDVYNYRDATLIKSPVKLFKSTVLDWNDGI